MTKDQLIQLVFSSLPYPHQITDLDTSGENHIEFKWRQTKYQVTTSLEVNEKIGKGMLGGTASTILMKALFESCANP